MHWLLYSLSDALTAHKNLCYLPAGRLLWDTYRTHLQGWNITWFTGLYTRLGWEKQYKHQQNLPLGFHWVDMHFVVKIESILGNEITESSPNVSGFNWLPKGSSGKMHVLSLWVFTLRYHLENLKVVTLVLLTTNIWLKIRPFSCFKLMYKKTCKHK